MEYKEKCSLLTEIFEIKKSHIISVSEVPYKVDVIEGLMKLHSDKEFSIIDDNLETLKECKQKLNISVYHPMEILLQ